MDLIIKVLISFGGRHRRYKTPRYPSAEVNDEGLNRYDYAMSRCPFPASPSGLHLLLNTNAQVQDGSGWLQPHIRKENTHKMKHAATSQKQRNQMLEIAVIIPLWLVIATCLTFT